MPTSQLIAKHFLPELKVSDNGEISSVIATLNVVDKDDDVTLPGFFGDQPVSVLLAHDWGTLPLGKGRIREQGDEAVFSGRMNLEDPNAKSAFSWLKFDLAHGEPIQEWSYGFRLHKDGFRFGEFEEKPVRFLTPTPEGSPGAKIDEVSLVLVGAGEGTRTLSVKGQKFSEHAEATLAVVSEFTQRARSLADLRGKDGRTLSEESLDKIRSLHEELGSLIESSPVDAPEGTPVGELPSDESIEMMLAQTEARIAGRV